MWETCVVAGLVRGVKMKSGDKEETWWKTQILEKIKEVRRNLHRLEAMKERELRNPKWDHNLREKEQRKGERL